MLPTLAFTLGLLAAPLATAGKAARIQSRVVSTTGPITSAGIFQVLVGSGGDVDATTSYTTTTPDDSVGCLNALGQLTLSDCAIFAPVDTYYVETSAGVCSFKNTSQPANTDDIYGASVYALTCWEHTPTTSDIEFYTIQGTDYDFLGTGDADLYYDIPALPSSSSDVIDFWYFVWGGEETGVPAGHYKALLLWVPSS
ncbi:hypothetical protein BD289DRAFT_482069 [Coniella lustricola]|uniref:Uncharacterized protein n=1 Tax=Coniella lustricola TaxID=2025994 RepID=A0A2T3AA66_9PEZI|nr:hypothetical protein BD289DRAFT_482069 [Coniella lustricola]